MLIWVITRSCLLIKGTRRHTHKGGHWSKKKTFKFHGSHRMLQSNVDGHEGIISKRCWNVCESNPMEFK